MLATGQRASPGHRSPQTILAASQRASPRSTAPVDWAPIELGCPDSRVAPKSVAPKRVARLAYILPPPPSSTTACSPRAVYCRNAAGVTTTSQHGVVQPAALTNGTSGGGADTAGCQRDTPSHSTQLGGTTSPRNERGRTDTALVFWNSARALRPHSPGRSAPPAFVVLTSEMGGAGGVLVVNDAFPVIDFGEAICGGHGGGNGKRLLRLECCVCAAHNTALSGAALARFRLDPRVEVPVHSGEGAFSSRSNDLAARRARHLAEHGQALSPHAVFSAAATRGASLERSLAAVAAAAARMDAQVLSPRNELSAPQTRPLPVFEHGQTTAEARAPPTLQKFASASGATPRRQPGSWVAPQGARAKQLTLGDGAPSHLAYLGDTATEERGGAVTRRPPSPPACAAPVAAQRRASLVNGLARKLA